MEETTYCDIRVSLYRSTSHWTGSWTTEKTSRDEVSGTDSMFIALTDVKSPTTPHKPFNNSVMQTIFNDTSLAAASLLNGDRHVFFQGADGSLRRIVRTAATSQWILDKTPVVISDARYLTPMTVYIQGASAEVQVGVGHGSKKDNTNVMN